jgi:hypothetical protein
MEALNAQHENEKERQRLVEAVKQHQIGQHNVPCHPEGKECSSSCNSRNTSRSALGDTCRLLFAWLNRIFCFDYRAARSRQSQLESKSRCIRGR